MKKGLLASMVILGFLASCKDGRMRNAFDSEDEQEDDSVEAFVGDTLHLFEEEELPVAVDELFDDFFFSFADDSRFQNQRIVFPLSYREYEDETKLTKQDWEQFDFFDAQEFYAIIYEREQDLELQKDTTIRNVGVEWIYLRDDYLEKLNFNRLQGKWMLTNILKENCEDTPNGDFLDFYSLFATDSAFQRNSLATPLKLILSAEDDEEENQEENLSADDWFNLKKDLPLPTETLVNIDYGQTCISQNRKTLLVQGLSNGLQIRFKFNKLKDEWKLIEIEY